MHQFIQMQPFKNDYGNDSDSSGEVEFAVTSDDDWPKPLIEYGFEIKPHDMLCNNRPFSRNHKGDRVFKINVLEEIKEVHLSATAGKHLIKLNREQRDGNANTLFLKGLVLGVCTIKRFRDFPDLIPFINGEIDFIKGFYQLS